jgi:hypothetical protein
MTCKRKTKYHSKSTRRRSGMARREQPKRAALALVETRREVSIRRGQRALVDVLLRSDTATADDVYAAVELTPEINPHCLRSVPDRLAYDRIIRPIVFVRSVRHQPDESWLQVRTLADRSKALGWLTDHPDLPDPCTSEGSTGA